MAEPLKADELCGSTSRTTKDGRKITYEMTVMQQPERARACGSGAKSSTDRRPVDPPPIVKLHVYHTDNHGRVDITARYNANFFLFATLETVPSPSQGRAPVASSALDCPVLTGVPVAALYYLERPEKAGYFIFSDLSVRQEGMYRMVFTLFEDTKEDRDKDWTPEATATNIGSEVPSACSRLQVKSKAFQVFSAKKFPGLFESTTLSRLVADQGCRVRIRRDIRLRKHETKSKEWNEERKSGNWKAPENQLDGEQLPVLTSESQLFPAHHRRDFSDNPDFRRASNFQGPQAHHYIDHGSARSSTLLGDPHSGQISSHSTGGSFPSHLDSNSTISRGHDAYQLPPHFQYAEPFVVTQQLGFLHHDGISNQQYSNAYNDAPFSATGYDDLRAPHRSNPQATFQTAPRSTGPVNDPANDVSFQPFKKVDRDIDNEHPVIGSSPDLSSRLHDKNDRQARSSSDVSLKRSYVSAFETQQADQALQDGLRPKMPHLAAPAPGHAPRRGESLYAEQSGDNEHVRLSYRRADGTEMIRSFPSFD